MSESLEDSVIFLLWIANSRGIDHRTMGGRNLREVLKLDPPPTQMIEHLDASQLIEGLDYIYRKAEECGVEFVNSGGRDIMSAMG